MKLEYFDAKGTPGTDPNEVYAVFFDEFGKSHEIKQADLVELVPDKLEFKADGVDASAVFLARRYGKEPISLTVRVSGVGYYEDIPVEIVEEEQVEVSSTVRGTIHVTILEQPCEDIYLEAV